MKQFKFSLDRALRWRESLVRLEEAKLEALQAEQSKIDSFEGAVRTEHGQQEKAVLGALQTSGAELAALERYRSANVRQIQHLHKLRAQCQQRIAAQRQIVTQRRLDASLLERLRQKRLDEWRTAHQREQEELASEAFLAKWNRQ